MFLIAAGFAALAACSLLTAAVWVAESDPRAGYPNVISHRRPWPTKDVTAALREAATWVIVVGGVIALVVILTVTPVVRPRPNLIGVALAGRNRVSP